MKYYLIDYDGNMCIVHVREEDVKAFLALYRELVLVEACSVQELLQSRLWIEHLENEARRLGIKV